MVGISGQHRIDNHDQYRAQVLGQYVIAGNTVGNMVGMWLVCGWYVVGKWSVSCWYVVGRWLVGDQYVVGIVVCGQL